MAINFPNAPSSGQVYEYGDYTYTFDGVKWTSILKYGLAAAKVSSETAPPNPEAGLMWYVPSTGESYLYYVDEDGGQWIQENPSIGAVTHGLLEGVNEVGGHDSIYNRSFSNVSSMIEYEGHIEGMKYSTGATLWIVKPIGEVELTGGLYATAINTPDIVDFGVIGDRVSDDSEALQSALEYSYLNYRSLSCSKVEMRISKTIYLPWYPTSTNSVVIDLGGSTLYPDSSVMVTIESGKLVNGVWVSSLADPVETYMSFGATLSNIRIEGPSDITKDGRYGIKVKDWHYGCLITKIVGRHLDTLIYAKDCFATEFFSCILFNQDASNRRGVGYIFDGNCNLIQLRRLMATNSGVGYKTIGAVTAMVIEACSFEGQIVGMQCVDEVYDLAVKNCYVENTGDVVFKFDSYVTNAVFSNNYFNFSVPGSSSAYLFDYLPLPRNNIVLEPNNMMLGVDDSRIFKTVDNTISYGMAKLEFRKRYSTTIDDFLVSNVDFPKSANVVYPLEQAGLKTHKVNNFAEGVYSGRFTSGRDGANGFEWVNTASSSLELRTKIVPSTSSRIYVSIRISGGTLGTVRGELVGDCNTIGNMDFYEYTPTGQEKTSRVTVSIVNGFFHIYYTHTDVVTAVAGEVRLA